MLFCLKNQDDTTFPFDTKLSATKVILFSIETNANTLIEHFGNTLF